jgi:hypothetical protein
MTPAVPDPFFSKDDLPDGAYRRYRKTFAPRAIRIEGTFHCATSEGNIASCTDGWLAIDSRGFPYPINSAEFDATYDLVIPDDDAVITSADEG